MRTGAGGWPGSPSGAGLRAYGRSSPPAGPEVSRRRRPADTGPSSGIVKNSESWNQGSSMDSYIVAYDISSPKRLRKVARACEDFGLRRQFSVFLCRLTACDLVRLKSRL